MRTAEEVGMTGRYEPSVIPSRAARARGLDDADFDAFARERWVSLLRYAYLLTGSSHAAEDLVQDALVTVYRNWARIDHVGAADRFARTTMARTNISWWRRARRELPTPSPDERAAVDLATTAERDAMWQRFRVLTKTQRAAIVLRYYEGMDDADVAAVLGCSAGTVRTHISRGLQRLRADAGDEGRDD